MASEKKKLKMSQLLWVGVTLVGNILILVSIVQSFWGVGAAHPTDPVQKYDCGSVLSPVSSLSDSKYSTDIVCKDAMAGRRGSVFWLEVFGFLVSTFGAIMLVLPHFRKNKEKVEEKPAVAKSSDE